MEESIIPNRYSHRLKKRNKNKYTYCTQKVNRHVPVDVIDSEKTNHFL